MRIPKPTSKRLRAKLAAKAKRSTCPVVKKSISKRTGKLQVKLDWKLWCFNSIYSFVLRSLVNLLFTFDYIRSGSTGLKRSQVYPRRYGKHVATIHKNYTVWVSNWLFPRLPHFLETSSWCCRQRSMGQMLFELRCMRSKWYLRDVFCRWEEVAFQVPKYIYRMFSEMPAPLILFK